MRHFTTYILAACALSLFGGGCDEPHRSSSATSEKTPAANPVKQFVAHTRGRVSKLEQGAFSLTATGKPDKRFLVGGIRVEGKLRGELWSHSYRLEQLRIGDELLVDYYHYNGIESSEYILIRRRPGGRVPEQPETPAAAGAAAWHRRMNAYQDWEERSIPLPPEYQDRPEDTDPPYPLPSLPVAPPPREVKRIPSN